MHIGVRNADLLTMISVPPLQVRSWMPVAMRQQQKCSPELKPRHSRDFGPRELKPLGSGQKRWAIQAQHEGHEMRREQFLEQGTLRGRWRLTPAGKKYAETHYVRVPEPS